MLQLVRVNVCQQCLYCNEAMGKRGEVGRHSHSLSIVVWLAVP